MTERLPVETEAAPAGEHIHMPAPSILPLINAAGLAVGIVGITEGLAFLIGGLTIFVIAIGAVLLRISVKRSKMVDSITRTMTGSNTRRYVFLGLSAFVPVILAAQFATTGQALALGFLLGKQRRQELLSLARGELARARANNAGSGDRSFWDRVALPDALLHVALFEGTLTEPKVIDEIDEAYVNALSTGPSARERASARDHLVFLAEMLPDPSLKVKLDTVPTAELERLITRLR